MSNYWESDEAISEIHDELDKREESKEPKIIEQTNPNTRFWVGMVMGVLAILYFTGKIDLKLTLLFLVAALIMLFMTKEAPQRRELTYIECMVRLGEILKFLQKHPIGDFEQVPSGEVRIYPVGRKQYYDGKPFKRSFEVRLYDEDLDIEEIYLSEVDVYSGDIITFRRAPEGVVGNEKKDIKLMPSQSMMLDRRRNEYMGVNKYGGGRR